MGARACPGKAYNPTPIEHVANTLSHGVSVNRTTSRATFAISRHVENLAMMRHTRARTTFTISRYVENSTRMIHTTARATFPK